MIYKRYMKWLASFIEKTDGFDNDYYKYNNEGASTYDIENVSNLEKFYRFIESYAEENDIDPSIREDEFFVLKNYFVKYNEKIYALGYISEVSTTFHCYLKPDIKNFDIIDFNDLIKNNTSLKCDLRGRSVQRKRSSLY